MGGEAAREGRTFGDRLLAGLLTSWALVSLLPLGAWADVADFDLYAEAWRVWSRLAAIGAVLAALVLAVGRERGTRGLRRVVGRAMRLPRTVFLGALGLVAALEAAEIAVACFARNPVHTDLWPQYFQAKVFLSGRVTAPMPPSVAHFATLNMLANEHGWFAQYPPLHAALLAVGMAFDVPWLTTPVLAALFPAAVFGLARRTGDERVARLAAALTVLSPFVITMSASGLNQLPAALCVAGGLAAAADLGRGGAGPGAVLGAAVGLMLGLRPLDGVVLALVAAAPTLATARRRVWPPLVAAAAAGATTLLPTLLFNAATTGHALSYGYSVVWGNILPFGEVPFGPRLTPLRALGYTALDSHELNLSLLAWPLPVTVLVAAGAWGRRGRPAAALRLAGAYAMGLAGLLSLFFFRENFCGPRYFFSAVPAVFVLLAAALVRVVDLEGPVGGRGLTLGDVAAVFLVTVAALSAALIAPQHLAALRRTGTPVALHPADDARRTGLAHAVVLLPDGWGNRLIARMWAAGVPVRDSPRLFRAFDACALEERLTAAADAGIRGPDLVARLTADAAGADPGRHEPTVTPDGLTRLPTDPRQLTPRCREEIDLDRHGVVEFAPFLHLNTPALDGDIVWAREIGPSGDAALRARYPDRRFYRYTIAEGQPAFVALEAPEAHSLR